MRSRVWPVVSVIVLASVAIATTGCSHDTLSSGTQDLSVVYTPSPAGAGRWDTAKFAMQKIQVVPTDPADPEIFRDEALLFTFDVVPADLTQGNAAAFAHVALAAGNYRVKNIWFTPPNLFDVQGSIPSSCADYFQTIDRLSSSTVTTPPVPSQFKFPDSEFPGDPPSPIFTVHPGQTTLSLSVNVPGLIAGYESSFKNCVETPTPHPTVFDAANFRAVLMANVRFE